MPHCDEGTLLSPARRQTSVLCREVNPFCFGSSMSHFYQRLSQLSMTLTPFAITAHSVHTGRFLRGGVKEGVAHLHAWLKANRSPSRVERREAAG